jgi:hypothetical protein
MYLDCWFLGLVYGATFNNISATLYIMAVMSNSGFIKKTQKSIFKLQLKYEEEIPLTSTHLRSNFL